VASEGGVVRGSVLPRETAATVAVSSRTRRLPTLPQTLPKWGPDLLGSLAAIIVALVLGSRMLGPNVSVPENVVAQFQPFSTIAPLTVRNWILSDVALVMYPNRVFMQRAFAAGQFPLWNPYILNGQPAAADPQMSLFYPPTHLFSHLSAARALDADMLLHLMIAALGMYVAVRVLRGRPVGAVVAAAAFAGCGTLTVWQQYSNVFKCAAWLPWLVVCFAMLQRGQRRLLWIGAGGLALGLVHLSNDVQWLLYDLLLIGAYALWMSIDAARTQKRRFLAPPFLDLSILIDAAAIVALGFGVGAVQFFPELSLAASTSRIGSTIPYSFVQAFAVPPERLLTLFAPNFFGTPTVLGSEWLPKSNYPESLVFWGFFPALIAFTAPLWRRGSTVWFFWISLVIEMSLAFGTPLLHLYALLPGYNALEVSRLGYLICFSGAMLVGLTFDRLFTHPHRWLPLVILSALAVGARGLLHLALPRFDPKPVLSIEPTRESLHWLTLVVVAGIALLAVNLLRQPRIRQLTAIGFALLAVVDIAHFSLPYNAATVPEASVFPRPQVFDALPPSVAPPRVVPINAKDSYLLLPPNMLETFGIADIGAYESLVPQTAAEFFHQIEPMPFKYNGYILVLSDYVSPLLDLTGADYFVSATPLDVTRKPSLTLVTSAQGVYLYRNSQAAPRAFIVTDVRPVETHAAVWPALAAPGYTPCAFATVEGPSPLTAPGTPTPVGGTSCVGSATITRYETNRVFLQAQTPAEGMLVLTDSYNPDWQVTVDGVRQPVLKADGPFRGVHLLPGTHDVRFEFRPTQIYRMGAVSGGSSVLCVALVALGLLWRRQIAPVSPDAGAVTPGLTLSRNHLSPDKSEDD